MNILQQALAMTLKATIAIIDERGDDYKRMVSDHSKGYHVAAKDFAYHSVESWNNPKGFKRLEADKTITPLITFHYDVVMSRLMHKSLSPAQIVEAVQSLNDPRLSYNVNAGWFKMRLIG